MPQRKGSRPRGAKKGGGGGKFTWGKAGEVLELSPLKKTDPTYDPMLDDPEYSDAVAYTGPEDTETVLAQRLGISVAPHAPELSTGASVTATVSGVPMAAAAAGGGTAAPGATGRMTLSQYKAALKPIINEFFSGADLAELYRSLSELDAPLLRWEFVKRAVTMSMDRTDREREMVSRALSELYDVLLTMTHIARGFERLLEQAEDLTLDVPDAPDTIAKFISRAVNDEILPPAWLTDPHIAAIGGPIVDASVTLLSIKQASARLERVWGVSDANASVQELKREVTLLVEEFFVTGDVGETLGGLKALGVPHFLHEAVKRALLLAIDRGEAQRTAVVALLAAGAGDLVITPDVMAQGVNIVAARLPDVALDTPAAPDLFAKLVAACIGEGALPEGFTADPTSVPSPTAAGGV